MHNFCNLYPDVTLINADFNDVILTDFIDRKVDLVIADPPYGKILGDAYDKVSCSKLIDLLYKFLNWSSQYCVNGATIYLFGGIGTYRNRPFFRFLSEVETNTDFRMHNLITWKKRRGYGSPYNYLFTREEIAMLVYKSKYPSIFNVPYLDETRSDAWLDRINRVGMSKYLPKSNRLRRTNVFVDISEVFQGHLVAAQKPEKLIEVLIDASSENRSVILDPFAGSGTVGLVCAKKKIRCCVCIEKNTETYTIMKNRLINDMGPLCML